MASPTQWTWVWINSGSWWWTGRPCMLQYMRSQRVRHNWATELNLKDTQQYVNRELPAIQHGFRKVRGTRDQIANIWWIIEKAREFQKNIYFCFIDYAKAFDCVDHIKLENSERNRKGQLNTDGTRSAALGPLGRLVVLSVPSPHPQPLGTC